MNKLTVADWIIQRLEQETDYVFCLVGGGAIFLVDALSRSRIKPIFLLHEQACVIAADAYAQASGRLGLVLVTTGPGVTNALTGVAASYIDSTPLMVLSGQVNTFHMKNSTCMRQKGIQEVDTIRLAIPITKSAMLCNDVLGTKLQLNKSIDIARTPRQGPVWLDIPLNIQKSEINW